VAVSQHHCHLWEATAYSGNAISMLYGFADSSQAALFSLSIRSRHRMFVVLHRIALHCIAFVCIFSGKGINVLSFYWRCMPCVIHFFVNHSLGVFKSDDRTASSVFDSDDRTALGAFDSDDHTASGVFDSDDRAALGMFDLVFALMITVCLGVHVQLACRLQASVGCWRVTVCEMLHLRASGLLYLSLDQSAFVFQMKVAGCARLGSLRRYGALTCIHFRAA
jgi:hypothetical protein